MLQFLNAWLGLLIDVSLKSLLLALLAATALAALRIRNVNVRHRVWTAVMIGMIALPFLVHVSPRVPLPSWMSVPQLESSLTQGEQIATAKAVLETPVTGAAEATFTSMEVMSSAPGDRVDPFAKSAFAGSDPLPQPAPVVSPRIVEVSDAIPSAVSATGAAIELDDGDGKRIIWTWEQVFYACAMVHVIVAVLLLSRIAIGLLLARRMIAASNEVNSSVWPATKNVRLVQSNRTSVPVTVGFWRPKVILPASWQEWSQEKLQSALAHELAHVRRADWLVTLLSEINRAIHWFNPLAWFLRRQLADLAEHNCDDAVIEARGDRAEYARHLLEVASALSNAGSRYRPQFPSIAMARKPAVETRIDAILDESRPLAKRLGWIGVTCMLAVVIPAIFFAAALSATNQAGEESASNDTPAEQEEPGKEFDSPTIDGRVIDSKGKPARDVDVVLTKIEEPQSGSFKQLDGFGVTAKKFIQTELARTRTDENGGFRIRIDAGVTDQTLLNLGVMSSKYGLGWMTADWNAVRSSRDVELRLSDAQDVRGRVVDLEGNPVTGVRVSLASIYRPQAGESIEEWIGEAQRKSTTKDLNEMAFHRERFGEQYPIDWGHGPLREGNPILPKDVVTDEKGAFEFAGLGQDHLAFFVFRGDSVTTTSTQVVARSMKPVVANPSAWSALRSPTYHGAEIDFVIEPSRPIVGVVKNKDSGEPLAGITVRLARYANLPMYQEGFLTCKTNDRGEYRLEGAPLELGHVIEAIPGDDQPFFRSDTKAVAGEADQPRADMELKQGVWITGQIDSGKVGSVPTAVSYYPLLSNELAPDYGYEAGVGKAPRQKNNCDQDGRFRVLGIPGEGLVVARVIEDSGFLPLQASDVPEHLTLEGGDRELNVYHGIWPINGFHALAEVGIDDGGKPKGVRLALNHGLRRKIALVDQQGASVTEALVWGRTVPPQGYQLVGDYFELLAMKPEVPRTLAIFNQELRLGRILRADAVDEPLTVTLQPCAVVRGRVVDEDAEGVEHVRIRASLDESDEWDGWRRELARTDTDAEGRFEVLLPPGGKCRISAFSVDGKSPVFGAEFDAKPNQVYSLGELEDGTELDAQETSRLATIAVAKRTRPVPIDDATKPLVYAGQVLTPDGLPAEGAEIRLVYWYSDQSQVPRDEPDAITDKEGRFRFEMQPTDFYRTGDSVPPHLWASLAATRDGYGLAWVHSAALEQTGAVMKEMTDASNLMARGQRRLRETIEKQRGPLRLPADNVPITGKVITTEGQPVAGVKVSLLRCSTGGNDKLDAWFAATKQPRADFYSTREATPKQLYGPLARKLVPPVTTNSNGEFTLRGIGQERLVELLFESPEVESAAIYCRTRAGEKLAIGASSQADAMVVFGPNVPHVTTPSKPITGVVRDASTGKPVAGVAVSSMRWTTFARDGAKKAGSDHAKTATDSMGRYTLTGLPNTKNNPVRFVPPAEAALMSQMTQVDTSGNDTKPIELNTDLDKGVLVTGRVVDGETGKGVSGQIQYMRARTDSEKSGLRINPQTRQGVEDTRADTNGSFQIVVPSGKGYLTFHSFDDTYQKRAHRPKNATTMAATAFDASFTMVGGQDKPEFHAVDELELAEAATKHHIEMTVSRGAFVHGIVVDPDGKKVSGHYAGRNEYPQWMPLEGSKFSVASFDPKFPRRLAFVSSDRKLSRALVLTGKVDQQLTVPLQPSCTLKGRIVDEHGDGIPDIMLHAGSMTRMIASSPETAATPSIPLPTVDNRHEAFMTDDEGRFQIEGLVAGEPYSIVGFQRRSGDFESSIQGDVVVDLKIGPGETHNLGDVQLKKPDFGKLRRQAEEAQRKQAEEAKKLNDQPASDADKQQNESDRASVGGTNANSGNTFVAAAKAPVKPTVDRENETSEDRVSISGKVLKPDGKPLGGAKLYWPRLKTAQPTKPDDIYLEHVATSGPSGEFVAKVVFPNLSWVRDGSLMVVADGFGLAWESVSKQSQAKEITLAMSEEFPIRGQVLNTEGAPIPDVTVGFSGIMADSSGKIDKLLTAWKREWRSSSMKIDKRLHVGIHQMNELLGNLPTDDDGRFEIRGLGKEQAVWLSLKSPAIAASTAVVITREGFEPESYNEAALRQAGDMALMRRQTPKLFAGKLKIIADPSKVIAGQVTDVESGAALEGVVVSISVGHGDGVMAVTDAEGNYRLSGIAINLNEVLVSFRKPKTRYLPRTLATKVSPGLAPMDFDAGLAKGVILKGRVTETESGKPVSGGIRFAPLEENKWKDKPGYDNYKRSRVMERVDQDGNFQFVSIPGPGVLMMQAGHSDIEIDGQFVKPYKKGRFSEADREKVRLHVEGESFYTSSNGLEFFENGMKVINIPEDVEEYTTSVTVDRGLDVDVAIVDDKGNPLAGSMVCGITESWPITYPAKEATCRIYALDPERPRRVIFYHKDRKLAGTLTLRGDEGEQPVAKLLPTTTLVGRAVDTNGDALAGATVGFAWMDDTAREFQRQLNMTREAIRTDTDGKFRIEGALPGVFRLTFSVDNQRYTTEKKWDDIRTVASTLVATAGAEVPLGDIIVKAR